MSFTIELKAPVHGLTAIESVVHQVDLLHFFTGNPTSSFLDYLAKLIINAFVGNSGHLLFDDEFDFALVLPKSTPSALTKQSDFKDLPLSISECLLQKVSRREFVGRLRHLYFVDHKLYLVSPSSLHPTSLQHYFSYVSAFVNFSDFVQAVQFRRSSFQYSRTFIPGCQRCHISVRSWATRLTFPIWDGSL